jgi:hypothetical protein
MAQRGVWVFGGVFGGGVGGRGGVDVMAEFLHVPDLKEQNKLVREKMGQEVRTRKVRT